MPFPSLLILVRYLEYAYDPNKLLQETVAHNNYLRINLCKDIIQNL